MASKQPTPQGVSRLLHRLGYSRSEAAHWTPGGRTEGYQARKNEPGTVRVTWLHAVPGHPDAHRRDRMLLRIADRMVAAGYRAMLLGDLSDRYVAVWAQGGDRG